MVATESKMPPRRNKRRHHQTSTPMPASAEAPSKRARTDVTTDTTTTTAATPRLTRSAVKLSNSAVRRVFSITELTEKILLACDQETVLTSACRVSKFWHSVIQTSPSIQRALFFLPFEPGPNKASEYVKNPLLEKHFSNMFSGRPRGHCHHVQGFPEVEFYTMFDVRFPYVKHPTVEKPTEEDSSARGHDSSSTSSSSTTVSLETSATSESSVNDETADSSKRQSATASVHACPVYGPSKHVAKWKTVVEWPTVNDSRLEPYFREGASWRRMLVRQPPVVRVAYAERAHVDVNYGLHPYYDYYKALFESPLSSRKADSSQGIMSVTTPAIVATGGLRMDRLYDMVQLNLARTTIHDPAGDYDKTFLHSSFHVYWNGTPKKADCPDDRMRKQIKRAVGKGTAGTLVVQITAVERPDHFRTLSGAQVAAYFGKNFRSKEAEADPHYVHKRGTHAITGPSWLKKKWVSNRVDDEALILHWGDMMYDMDDDDDLDYDSLEDFDDYLWHSQIAGDPYLADQWDEASFGDYD